MFGVSIVAAGVLIVRMPADFLTRQETAEPAVFRDHPLIRGIVWFAKNAVGFLMLIAGVVMLVTPGQGLLFIFLGLTLADFPGKRKLLRKLLRRPGVLNTINSLRKRAGRSPIDV